MAFATVADLFRQARVFLQDTIEPYRYDNTSLLDALNMGLLEARRLRPDLFMDRATPSYSVVDTTTVAIDEQYRIALMYYMVGQVQLRDDEEASDQRAAALLGKFETQLLGLPV